MDFVGDWDKARKVMKAASVKSPLLAQQAIRKSTAQAALILERRIKEVFRKGGEPKWKTLSPVTRKWHSEKNPLSDRSDLFNAVRPMQVEPGVWFVGVARNARTKQAKTGNMTTYRVALVHEFGVFIGAPKGYLFIPLTRAMETAKRRTGIGARVAQVQGKRPKRGVHYALIKHAVYIPPRPFIGPGVEAARPEVERVMEIGLGDFFAALSKG